MASQNAADKQSFFQKTKNALGKAASGEPISKIRGTASAEDFWPAGLDAESKRAAAVLRTFFIDGFVVPYRTLNSIPNEVISFHPNLIAQSTDRYQVLKHAKGVAVITILREGLRSSESDGSGIVVLRLANGNWSPPAAVAVHVGGGWDNPEIGDAYDCLCVINEEKVNKGFDHSTCTFGDAVPSPTDGPLGGSLNDSRIDKPKSPVWMYIKAKGHWIEQAQLKGVSLEYRKSENESFYGSEGIQMKQILHGEVQPPTGPVSQLLKILKAVETGNHNSSNLPSYGKSPGDYSLKTPSK